MIPIISYSQDYQSQYPVQLGDRPAQYILGNEDVLLITVNLWGHVKKPGIYSIPSNFGIIDLLSSAGGCHCSPGILSLFRVAFLIFLPELWLLCGTWLSLPTWHF